MSVFCADLSLLTELVQSVWQQVLGLPITLDEDDPGLHAPADLSACVQILGAWNGAVLLRPSDRLAVRAASIMFGIAPGEVTAADAQDALAELGNILGGNLKAILPGPSTLSLPTVTRGQQHEVFVRGTQPAAQLGFACESEPVSVALYERADPPESSLAAGRPGVESSHCGKHPLLD